MVGDNLTEMYTLRDFDKLVADQDLTIILGAPGIGKSDRLNKIALEQEEQIIRSFNDVLNVDVSGSVIFDDFYDLFKQYLNADLNERQNFKSSVRKQLEAEGSTLVCTTPYRLQWVLENYGEEFDKIFNGLTGWTVEPVRVDRDDAAAFLQDQNQDVSIETFEKDIEWCYDLDKNFKDCLRDGEKFGEIFGDIEEYRTLIPGILTSIGPNTTIHQAVSDRTSVRQSLKWMFKDVSASEAMDQGSGFIDGAREYVKTLKEEDAFNTLKESIGSVIPETVSNLPANKLVASSAGAALSPPVLAVGCLGYWAWATQKQDEETRETVREEFESILGTDILELAPADRENLEAEFGLEPKTLLYLNRAASGVTWEKLDRTINKLENTAERVDHIEETVERHEETIETVIDRLALTGGTQGYMKFWEFENELYAQPEYVPPSYEINDDASDPFGLGDTEPTKGENALEKLLEIIDQNQSSVTTVTGESGIGKSRLLTEVGRELRNEDEIDTWYIRDPAEFTEPLYECDTVVVFLDEVGRMDNTEKFFNLTSGNWREFGVDCTVHVIASVRPVYKNEINTLSVPNTVEHTEIELDNLTEASTELLLSDIDVSESTIRKIHATTDGNPFLSRLIALAEGEVAGDSQLETKIQQVIEKTMLNEADLLQSDPKTVRLLLKAIAILSTYDSDEAEEPVIEYCDIGSPGKHDELLSDLSETNYIMLEGKETNDSQAVYTHKVDVFAEWLRLDVLVKERMYEKFISQCTTSSLRGLARGLVELNSTTLKRFEFFPEEEIHRRLRDQLETVGQAVLQSDGSIEDVISVQSSVATVAPDRVSYNNLEKRYIQSDTKEQAAYELVEFIRILYRNAILLSKHEDMTKGEGSPSTSVPEMFEYARTWVKYFQNLSESYSNLKTIRVKYSEVLFIATSAEGEAGQFDAMQACLEDLKKMAKNNPYDSNINLQLAAALVNATGYENLTNLSKNRISHLDSFESIIENHLGNEAIAFQLANALLNAVKLEGNADQLNAMQTRHNLLEKIAEKYAGYDAIQLVFARSLVNVGMQERNNGHIDKYKKRIDRLENLVEKYPQNEEIHHQFAKGLIKSTITVETTDSLDDMRTQVKRLENFVNNHPDLTGIPLELAKSLRNASIAEADFDYFNIMQRWIDRLRKLASNHTDTAIPEHLAKALNYAVIAEGNKGDFAAVERHIRHLETLVDDYPLRDEIHNCFADALYNGINFELRSNRLDAMRMRLDRLDTLVENHPNNDNIIEKMADTLVDVAGCDGEAGRISDMEKRVLNLEKLAQNNPHHEKILNDFAIALHNAAVIEGKAGDKKAALSRIERLEEMAEEHTNNPVIHYYLSKVLTIALTIPLEDRTEDQIIGRLNQLLTILGDHPDHTGIVTEVAFSHIYTVQLVTRSLQYKVAEDIINVLYEISDLTDEFDFEERSGNAEKLFYETGTYMILGEKVSIFESLLATIENCQNEVYLENLNQKFAKVSNELLDQNRISKQTHTEVEMLCTDNKEAEAPDLTKIRSIFDDEGDILQTHPYEPHDVNINGVDLEDIVVKLMSDLDRGKGATKAEVISRVSEKHDVDVRTVENAIENALMNGRCYEVKDEVFKSI